MCGIVGLVSPGLSRANLEHANKLLAHRGPDDEGFYVGEGVGLAARRLSIIDLSGGHQPLSNEDGSIWITYNGEVYNAPELHEQLLAAGHQFRTQTDTETVVHAYEEWGDACVARLRGMFAFGIWDSRRQRLLLARDRFGIKPLYYARLGADLAFASEVAPLFSALPNLPRRASRAALSGLFSYGFILSPLSAFEGVLKVPAAHTLVYEDAQVTLRPYWQMNYPPANQRPPASPEALAHQFVTHLREAVEAWRLSDVPVGSLLSGGVDSASLAALLAEISGEQIHTFTIGFTAATHDESALAREAARAIGSHHHELTFSPADFEYLPQVLRHLEEPQCSATSVPIYLLYKACREAGFKVIMTGEGADELLGGYHWFEGDRRMRPLLKLPRPVRAALASLPIQASSAARRVLVQGSANHVDRYWQWQQVAAPREVNSLLQGAAVAPQTLHPDSDHLHPLDLFLLLESQSRMVDFINFEVDRMSMASSVEARPPFLDHELWEYCGQLPPDCKLSPNGNKLLLRVGMQGRLPDSVLKQPKRGLAAPHAQWLRGTLPAWAEEALHPAALQEAGYFQPGQVAHLRSAHQAGQSDHSRLLMGILTTQLWHSAFIC